MYSLCKILKYVSEIIWRKILLKIEHSVFEKNQGFFFFPQCCVLQARKGFAHSEGSVNTFEYVNED